MKIIFKKKIGDIMQITSLDERWYAELDNMGRYKGYRPSLTWIISYTPKGDGKGYEIWIGDNGYNESQRLMKEAGERGSRIHRAIEELLKKYMNNDRKGINMIDEFIDLDGAKKDLAPDEWHALMTFVQWFKQKKIKKVLSSELTLLTKEFGCTLDTRYIYEKGGRDIYGLTDFKTSQQNYVSSEGQLSGQIIACKENGLRVDEASILQVGYRKTIKGYKETVYPFQPELFEAAYTFWKKENLKKKPYQRDYPLTLNLL